MCSKRLVSLLLIAARGTSVTVRDFAAWGMWIGAQPMDLDIRAFWGLTGS